VIVIVIVIVIDRSTSRSPSGLAVTHPIDYDDDYDNEKIDLSARISRPGAVWVDRTQPLPDTGTG